MNSQISPQNVLVWSALNPPPPPKDTQPVQTDGFKAPKFPCLTYDNKINGKVAERANQNNTGRYQEQPYYHTANQQDVELSKPWINDYLAREIRRKYFLKSVAGKSKHFEDFESYRRQRESVQKIYTLARDAYFRNNYGEESQWLPQLAIEAAQEQFSCENCDREFSSEKELSEHEYAHETCGLDGCTYTSNPKQVEIHILHLHSTGLYLKQQKKGKEMQKSSKEPNKEADEWRELRKKNFPGIQKAEQAKRQRKLKYERKLKFLESRKQKEIERNEAWQKRREEQALSRDEKRIRQNKHRNRGKTEVHRNDQKSLPINDTSSIKKVGNPEEISQVINANTSEIASIASKPVENVSRGIKRSNPENISNPYRKKSAKQNINTIACADLPFWFGLIEPFKGTKYDYNGESGMSESGTSPIQKLNTFFDEQVAPRPVPKQTVVRCNSILNGVINGIFSQAEDGPIVINSQHDKKQAVTRSSTMATPKKDVPCRSQIPTTRSGKSADMNDEHVSKSSPIPRDLDQDESEEPPDEEPVLREISVTIIEPASECTEAPKDANVSQNITMVDNTSMQLSNQNVTLMKNSSQNIAHPKGHANKAANPNHNSNFDPEVKRHSFKVVRKAPQPPTLLEKLLNDNIERERDELVQCIRYVVEKKFFQV